MGPFSSQMGPLGPTWGPIWGALAPHGWACASTPLNRGEHFAFGRPLGVPGGSLGALGGAWGVLGRSLGVLRGSQGGPGGSFRSLEVQGGASSSHWKESRGGSGGVLGGLRGVLGGSQGGAGTSVNCLLGAFGYQIEDQWLPC